MARKTLLGLALFLSACSDDAGPVTPPPPPGPPASVSILRGGGQEGPVETTLPIPLLAEVTDSAGRPVPGVELRWFVPSWPRGGEPVEPVTVTDSIGRASNQWSLGTFAGEFAMVAQWYEDGMAAPIGDSVHARVLPGPIVDWILRGDTLLGLQPGDSVQIVAVGVDEFHNGSTDGDPPVWSVVPAGIVSVSGTGLVRGLSPGSALVVGTVSTGPPLHVRVGVNASTEELVRLPTSTDYWILGLSAIDGSGPEMVVAGLSATIEDYGWFTPKLWRLRGTDVTEGPITLVRAPAYGNRADVVVEGGRSWLAVPWEGRLLVSSGGDWEPVFTASEYVVHTDWHLAARGSGGVWLTYEVPYAGWALVSHDGSEAVRHTLPDTIRSAQPAEDGAGNVYIAGHVIGQHSDDQHAYVARRDGEDLLPMSVPAQVERIVRLRGARRSALAWAVGRSTSGSGDDYVITNDVLRIQPSRVEVMPDPLNSDSWRVVLAVRGDGVPYLAADRRVAWLENGVWRVHWLEEEGWDVGGDLYVDDDGVMYQLVGKVGPNPTWPSPPTFPAEGAILVIRP